MVKQSRVRHSFRRPGADTSGSSERRPIGGLLGHLVGARGLLGSSTTIKKPPPLPPAAESASAAQAAAEKATAAENAKGRHQRKKARRYLKRKAEWEASRNAPAANSARSPAARGAAGQDRAAVPAADSSPSPAAKGAAGRDRAAVPAADSSPSPAAKGAAGRDRAALGETVQGGTVPDSADVPFALRSVPTKAERRKAIKKRKKAEARGEVYVPPVSVAVAEDGPASKRARTSARTDASNASNASSASDGRASQTSTGERVLKMGVRIQELLAGKPHEGAQGACASSSSLLTYLLAYLLTYLLT